MHRTKLKLEGVFLLLLQTAIVHSQTIPGEWLTDYEKSGFRKTPRDAETIDFCRRLEHASPWIKVLSFGKTPEGRDLHLVIASKDGSFEPNAFHARLANASCSRVTAARSASRRRTSSAGSGGM